jgi:hypothetical protein
LTLDITITARTYLALVLRGEDEGAAAAAAAREHLAVTRDVQLQRTMPL